MARHVADEVLLLTRGPAKDLPQAVGLLVVMGLDFVEQIAYGDARPFLVGVGGLDVLVGQGTVAAGVVGVGAVVAIYRHGTITLEGVEGVKRRIYGDLLVVDAESVPVGIGVGEQAGLEHGVR